MASGQKRSVTNNSERAISNDRNRAEAFLGTHVAEIMRWLTSAVQGEGMASVISGSTSNPMFGVVFNGLWARPEIGTTNLFIEPGVVGLVNPDSVAPTPDTQADDSPFKIVVDPGVQLAGQLTMTAGGASTRIDVIECSRTQVVTESSNRDIFNPATGLFTPASVPKVVVDQLSYRIRTGTAGGGFASVGTASGWMPLAVASVPAGATTWDQATLWDVRRLVAEFVRAPSPVTQVFSRHGLRWATAFQTGGTRTLRGVLETEDRASVLGGELGNTLSNLTNGEINMLGNDFLEPGYAASASALWSIFLMTPFGLPRWAKYTPAAVGARVPNVPRGIPVFTSKNPLNHKGAPTSAISLPTDTGLGGSSSEAQHIMSGVLSTAAAFQNTTFADNWIRFDSDVAVSPTAGSGTASARYDLVDNVHWPVGAVAVLLRFSTTIAGTAASTSEIDRQVFVDMASPAGVINRHRARFSAVVPAAASFRDTFEIELPLHNYGAMPNGSVLTRRFTVDYGIVGFAATYSAQTCTVVGFRMGQR